MSDRGYGCYGCDEVEEYGGEKVWRRMEGEEDGDKLKVVGR